MPWNGRTEMEERKEFLCAAERQEKPFAQLCREYGISRKTGYKWVKREKETGSLEEKSRAPHRPAGKTTKEIEEQILRVREENPCWGGKRIKKVLENAGYEGIPSEKTCTNILKRHGYIDPAEAMKHKRFQRFQRESCNELWQMDFKGDFLLGDKSRCYPLDILDDHSRYCILLEAKSAQLGVIESLERAFRVYGLPDALLSDNGPQFAGTHKGLSRFERFLMDLDVLPIHGRPYHPQTQGKIERFHRSMKAEVLRSVPEDIRSAQKSLNSWRWKYNEIRPHHALGMKTPADVYVPSTRSFAPPKPFEYDSAAKMIKINNWGFLRFGPIQLFLSETMADTYVEIRPSLNDIFLVIYRNYKIAAVDVRNNLLLDRTIRKL